MKRVIVGGLLGGLVLFLWGMISHTVLPLGTAGIRSIPPEGESAVLAAMKSSMSERALYIFPGIDTSHHLTAEEQETWRAKYVAGPVGVVAFSPRPEGSGNMLLPMWIGKELLANLLAGLVAAVLVMSIPGAVGYRKRVLLLASLGLVVTLDVDVSYWNWYSFPTSYAAAQLIDHTVGWLLAALVLARICVRRAV